MGRYYRISAKIDLAKVMRKGIIKLIKFAKSIFFFVL